MPANKGGRKGQAASGLADLKRLHKAAVSAAAAPPSPPKPAKASGPVKAARIGIAGLDQEDTLLFRRAMKTVTPIKKAHRMILPAPPLAPGELLRQRRERAVGQEPLRLPQTSDHYTPAKMDGDDARYLRRGHGPDVLKGLKRGKWAIEASLDLHGSTLEQARERLDRFLESCLAHRIKCVRIVHGKGYGSKDGESVLKQTIRRWLSQIDSVTAYVECSEPDGGAGAVQVLLQVPAAERGAH